MTSMAAPSVGIIQSDFHGVHTTAWGPEWKRACVERGVPHELIDWRAHDSFARMARHAIVLWHFNHYSVDEMRFARPILAALKAGGCTVFPDAGDADHFDDKVAQAYLLRSLGLPTPTNHVLHGHEAVEEWIRLAGVFPVVAKLRSGSGASGVTLIMTPNHLRRYARRMFGSGVRSRPSVVLKIRSNLASARTLGDIAARARRAPEFLYSLRKASQLPRESGYVYLQEFIPGCDHDIKVVVVGDQLSFICRAVRAGEFRASGSGALFYERALISPSIVEVAFTAAQVLRSECTGFDMVVDSRTGQPLILEVSYGFSHEALLRAGGYFDRSGAWHDVPLNAPRAVLDRMLWKANGG
jgi:glutathione synthase/RimK-type ligase-like ATP-grasp enzyme